MADGIDTRLLTQSLALECDRDIFKIFILWYRVCFLKLEQSKSKINNNTAKTRWSLLNDQMKKNAPSQPRDDNIETDYDDAPPLRLSVLPDQIVSRVARDQIVILQQTK
jgi:hypothetical protein